MPRAGAILGVLHEVEVSADRGVNRGGDMGTNKLKLGGARARAEREEDER